MSVIDGLAKHLQERVNESEPEVERLRRANAELREALRPFAEAHRKTEYKGDWYATAAKVRVGDFARAAELVPATEAEKPDAVKAPG